MSGDLVTVCDSCLRACCWHGEFMCDDAKKAGTTEVSRARLKALNLEHPNYWNRDDE